MITIRVINNNPYMHSTLHIYKLFIIINICYKQAVD